MSPNSNRNPLLQNHHHCLPHWMKKIAMTVTNVCSKVEIENLWIWLLMACTVPEDTNLIFCQKIWSFFLGNWEIFSNFCSGNFVILKSAIFVFCSKQKELPSNQNKLQFLSKQSVLERRFWNKSFLKMNLEEIYNKNLSQNPLKMPENKDLMNDLRIRDLQLGLWRYFFENMGKLSHKTVKIAWIELRLTELFKFFVFPAAVKIN